MHLHEAAHILTEVIEEMKNSEAIFDEGMIPRPLRFPSIHNSSFFHSIFPEQGHEHCGE